MNSRFKWIIVSSSTLVVVLLLLGARNGRAVPTDDVYGHLKVYTEVLERIKVEYVEDPDIKSVTLGAINGLLESVDPFASYLNADQYRQYEKGEEAAKAGVGAILAKRYGYVAIVDVLPGSPADKANISTGDLIESINNVATRGYAACVCRAATSWQSEHNGRSNRFAAPGPRSSKSHLNACQCCVSGRPRQADA